MTVTALRRGPARGSARDSGFTLVEYTVSMAIFTVVIAITAGGIAMMSRDVVKTTNLSTSTDQIRQGFSRLDRQVRYASEVNFPGKNAAGTSWYFEFLAPDGDGAATCYQARVDTAADVFQERSWSATSVPASAPAWTTIASNVANSPTADQPFTFVQASTTVPYQGIELKLIGRRASTHTSTVTLETSLTARNSSVLSESNADSDGDGQSDDKVCYDWGRP
jgi:prepilin-type N-terminal cleavage/methylation domain-containing protein